MIRMQVFRRRFLIAASLFLVVLTFPAFVNPTSVTGDGLAPDYGQGHGSGIHIKGNEDFKGKYDFEGEGTVDDPFIIEGLQISVGGYGIRIRDTTSYFIIRDCEFVGAHQGWGGTAIYFSRVENGVVENCAFTNLNRGVEIHKSENNVIQQNEFNSVMTGIRIRHSSSIQVSNNEIANTRWIGLYIAYSYDCLVTDNMIVNNGRLGVLLYDSGLCTLFGNYFEDNGWGNAKDVSGELTASDANLWDDDVSLGNDWDDYEGTGVYPIPGNRGSVDRYPIGSSPIDTTAPVWNPVPEEEQVIESGESFKLLVTANDENGISFYWIDKTDLFSIDSEGNITSNDLLALGEYELEVRAYDPFNNFCSATFTVKVQDTVSPEIIGPVEVTYKEGDTGNKIAWSVSDINPSIYTIFVDDVEVEHGSWNEPTGAIEIFIDGLSAGEYKYRLEVCDLGTNSASDEVTVTVEGKTPVPTTTIPKPKTGTDGNPPTEESMAGPYIEPVVVASGIGIPTALGFAILFVIGKRREVA
ncbi:MAG: right-handed parallel beta-helix repeat-containing protein [Candidatus Thorarchaeota archaeon]